MELFWNYKLRNKEMGSSLIEIIIALAIFALISSSLVSLILGSYNIIARDEEIGQARNFANQGVEVVRAIGNRAWNELIYNESVANFDPGYWELTGEGTSEQIGKYDRTIKFFDVFRDENHEIVDSSNPGAWLDVGSKEVEVVVGWEVGFGGNYKVERRTYLTNWDTRNWEQVDWSGGAGQTIWLDDKRYESDDGNIESGVFSISLKEIATSSYPLSGYFISSAFGVDEYENFNIIEWAPSSTVAVECPDCEIRIQIKTAADFGGSPGAWTSTWSGPDGDDGDEGDYFTESRGELISTDHNGDRWIKYKVEFLGDGNHAPILERIIVRYK